jgi:methionyl-tRNA formyltransferase
MRIVYMGTPAFAVPPLEALVTAGHEVVGVVTRTDKPAGRGKTLTPPAVKVAAEQAGLAVLQPRRVREPEAVASVRALAPEVIVVAAYGQILPKELLTLPPRGCVNIHASLLPAYRGAAPINWAIINGEERTGITIMQMDEGMDTGAILLQDSIPIAPDETAGTLTGKLAHLGSALVVDALNRLEGGTLPPIAQDDRKASHAPLLRKEDGRIDWSRPAVELHRRVRGLTPWPGAFTYLDGKLIKLLETTVVPGGIERGELALRGEDQLVAGTGHDLLRIKTLQPEGKRPMSAADFLRGHRDVAGKKFITDDTRKA